MYIFWGQKSVCGKGAKLWRQNLWLQLVFLQTSVGILPLLDEAILVGNKQIWFIKNCKENKRMRVSKQMDIFDELEDLYLSMIHFTFEFFCKFTYCLPLGNACLTLQRAPHHWLCALRRKFNLPPFHLPPPVWNFLATLNILFQHKPLDFYKQYRKTSRKFWEKKEITYNSISLLFIWHHQYGISLPRGIFFSA